MVIPNPSRPYSVLERIGEHTRERRRVSGLDVTFVVEKVRGDSFHPCTISDLVRLLEQIPASDWAGIETIVFRQPTRKQAILDPAWGRLRYWGELSTGQGRVVATGPMIFLEAVEKDACIEWPSGLDPEDQIEFDRLRSDGHVIERQGGRFVIRVSPESARNTQLFRTLPHEIGYWFDWLEKVEAPAARGEDFGALTDRYFARPKAEREAFAHRYADRTSDALKKAGAIPFEPQR